MAIKVKLSILLFLPCLLLFANGFLVRIELKQEAEGSVLLANVLMCYVLQPKLYFGFVL